jgi:hypothetical protein
MASATRNTLVPIDEVAALIRGGASLALAGTEAALERLPAGNWIGGTTPYFLTERGGKIVGDDEVFVTDLTALGTVTVAAYGADQLDRICGDAPDSGFSMAIMPAQSACHQRFALDAPTYADALMKPVVGWIAGFNVQTGGQGRVYDGRGPTRLDDRAVVLHVAWNDGAIAQLEIINPFTVGDGDVLTFAQAGFAQTHCIIDGVERRFADHLVEHGLDDLRRPLVGDHGGAPINVAVQSIDREGGVVRLYAPVFPGTDYRFAAPLDDYSRSFADLMAGRSGGEMLWSCNCVLNFLFGELEGRTIPSVIGPVTFGEIAYQLLTQTMVVLKRV